jgi:hypothetical protein
MRTNLAQCPDAMAGHFFKYNAKWELGTTPLQVEMACIRLGGEWKKKDGTPAGNGKSFHFEEMRKLIHPDLDAHRWHDLARDEMCRNKVTVLMGSGGTGKTHSAAWLFLYDYWCFPNETMVLISSTDLRGLELRVWGEIKKLFESGQAKFPELAGNLLESKHAIATDNIEEDKVRDLRKGIIGIPCIQQGKFVGLGKYVGIHQKRVRLVADEAQFMSSTFLSAFANLNQNEDFWAVVLGNPNDPMDSLGRAAEPKDGWSAHDTPSKTSVWDTKFMNGRCVNLIGTDSPNFDYPLDQPTRYKYLPRPKFIAETLATFGMDSMEYHSQCVGSMRTGVLLRRVLTRDMCRQYRAEEDVVWAGSATTRIYGVDSAYGGDRCVGGWIEFGKDVDGKTVICVHPPRIIPIRIMTTKTPEDQIAECAKEDCENAGIPPENMFHDATGRGSLGTALARIWSAQTNPVEFGGKPTDRPVSMDFFIYDPILRIKRLKMCSEHYKNFVTELWWSIRFAVEASQIRELPEDVMEELCMRQWSNETGKIQVEPKTGTDKKPGMKQRTGRSPDLADWFAICVEGARRRGFQISKLANADADFKSMEWLTDAKNKQQERHEKYALNFNA